MGLDEKLFIQAGKKGLMKKLVLMWAGSLKRTQNEQCFEEK